MTIVDTFVIKGKGSQWTLYYCLKYVLRFSVLPSRHWVIKIYIILINPFIDFIFLLIGSLVEYVFPHSDSCFCFVLLLLLLLFLSEEMSCPCPEIPDGILTEPPPKDCFKIKGRFRYSCKTGYVRKAGTSNLITCDQSSGNAQWTEFKLTCIRTFFSDFYHLQKQTNLSENWTLWLVLSFNSRLVQFMSQHE